MNQLKAKTPVNGNVGDGGSRVIRDGIRLDNTVTIPTIDNRYKAVVSGKLVELYIFEKPLLLNRKGKKHRSLFSIRSNEYRERTAYRGSFHIRRLLYASFTEYSKFITLTFRDTDSFDIFDLKVCNRFKSEFIAKLKRNLKKNLKYVVVPEFQKRGAVHYHIICDLPFLEKEHIAKLWPHGFLDVRAIPNIDKQAYYLSKYISKNRIDPRFEGNKTYFTSRGLAKPTTIYGHHVKPLVEHIKQNHLHVTRHGSFDSKFNGKAIFSEYHLLKKGIPND